MKEGPDRNGVQVLTWKRELKRLNSSLWGQHLIHPIRPGVRASRTKHKTPSRGEEGESMLVKKATGEHDDQ